ncbi:TadE family type IV pilus minor pilin [Paenarthrobacter sp. NPDC056912]|uniref:TadE family type IV pilus minor pilin n=1 Tax=Paenarthrobacter sp. NPDC056912 TaxID=3345965 RepID=UPI00366F6575
MTQVSSAGTRRVRAESCLGAVTAEFAVALPAVVLLLAFLLAGGAAGITQLRLEEAARSGARASARGDSAGSVEGVVRRLAGAGASSAVTNDGEWLTVTASARVGGALGPLIPWTLTASASARGEVPQASAAVPLPRTASAGLWRLL